MSPENLKEEALMLMAHGGFPIRGEVTIAVDEKLPFMGYTTQQDGHPLIVISQWSLQTGMVMGLIIHELSHVYRIETNHPSHNATLHARVIETITHGQKLFSYQQESMHSIINVLQDLYADDISFPVYIQKSQGDHIDDFFLGWIHDPLLPSISKKTQWKNAEYLVNTAFAAANLRRHHIEDKHKKIENAVSRFLAQVDTELAESFGYFMEIMVTMPENISEEDFGALLQQYIQTFVRLAGGI